MKVTVKKYQKKIDWYLPGGREEQQVLWREDRSQFEWYYPLAYPRIAGAIDSETKDLLICLLIETNLHKRSNWI